MPRGRRYVEEYSSESDDMGEAVLLERRERSSVRSVSGRTPSRHRERRSDYNPGENIYIDNHLYVPGADGRPRTLSNAAQAVPVMLAPTVVRSPSRSHSRHHRHYEKRDYSSSDNSRSPSRRSRREGSRTDFTMDEMRKNLELMSYERQRAQRDYEDAKIEDRRRRERLEWEIEEDKRKDKRAQDNALYEAEQKAAKDKAMREALRAEFKAEEERKKKEQEDTEKRILLEAELKKKQKEADDKALREKILAEEEEKKRKEKEKKKKEEAEFEERLRQKGHKAGLSDGYIDDLLDDMDDNNGRHHYHGHRSPTHHLTDGDLPTWVRVNRRHVLPETLDYYRLRWDFDDDNEHIIIKQEIDYELQRELFDHTKRILRSRKTITSGYEKETVTTLTPRPKEEKIVKKNDKLYLVRSKSKSPAPRRLSFVLG